MLLDEKTMSALHEIAQMRGIPLHRHHCETVMRELRHHKQLDLDVIFDRFRALGCRMSFAAEKGLRQWLTDVEQTRQHRRNLDIERTRRALNTDRPIPYRYRGQELRELLRHDVDERGYMRGPVMRHEYGLRGNPSWVL